MGEKAPALQRPHGFCDKMPIVRAGSSPYVSSFMGVCPGPLTNSPDALGMIRTEDTDPRYSIVHLRTTAGSIGGNGDFSHLPLLSLWTMVNTGIGCVRFQSLESASPRDFQ